MNFKIIIVVFCSCFGYNFAQSSCRTPNGEIAYCIPIYNCSIFVIALRASPLTDQVKQFMKESTCVNEISVKNIYVCCGSLTDYEDAKNPQQANTPAFTNEPPPSQDESCGLFYGGDEYVAKPNELKINEYPWTALIEYRNQEGSTGHHCGGVLINHNYVLTAAHCVTGNFIKRFGNASHVRLGEYDRSTDKDCVDIVHGTYACYNNHQNIAINQFLTHPLYRYNNGSYVYDIALIRLEKFVNYTDFIRPICLTRGITAFAGTEYSVAGWGINENSKGHVTKHLVTAFGLQNQHCSNFNPSNIPLTAIQFCAVKSGAQELKKYCGDTGGAIVTKTSNTDSAYYVLVGIESFSFSSNNDNENFIIIYTKISEFSNWIAEEVRL